jgi:glucokinase
MAIVGADLGGTKLAIAMFSDAGEILERDTVLLNGRTGHEVATVLLDRLQRIVRERRTGDALRALGVSVPGIYRSTRGTVWAPNIPGWDDFPLRDVLRDALHAAVTVAIDSDRAAYISGETWRGAAQGARNAIYLAVGTGIGAGIMIDGNVLRGAGDVAGAIGWLGLQRPYDARWESCGCFEYQASGPGLVRVARELLTATPSYSGELRGLYDRLTTAEIFAAADRDDPIATQVIENAIELWGMAAANLVSLFNPEIIVFGGGVFGPATKYLDRIRNEAERWAQPIAIRQVKFVASALGADAGLYGAARLADKQ